MKWGTRERPRIDRAVMNGYTDAYADDHELLSVAVTVYEALYHWCRRQR